MAAEPDGPAGERDVDRFDKFTDRIREALGQDAASADVAEDEPPAAKKA